jgi:flagellar protein FlgJ
VTNPIDRIATAATGTAKAATNQNSPELVKLRKVAQQFEAVFLRQMIGSMRKASPGDGLLDSSASEQFRDMSDSRMADAMAGKGALGVADMLVKQLGARLVGQAAAKSAEQPK